MALRKLVPLLILALLPACKGCTNKGEPPSATSTASAKASKHKRKPARVAPAPTPTSSALAPGEEPRWLRQALKRKPTVAPGDMAWVVAPQPGLRTAAFGVMAIDSVQEDSVTAVPLVLKEGKVERDPSIKLAKAPASLVTAVTPIDPAKVKPGDLVIASIPGFRVTAAQVMKVEGKTATVKYVKDDKVLDGAVEYVMPLAKGVQPFAYAAFPDAGLHEILITAVVNDVVFGIDDLGNVFRVEKADAKPINVELKDRNAGDVVSVFYGTSGSDVHLDSVVVPRWLYTVKVRDGVRHIPFYAILQ
jgi:hypothetical protein